ncbi:MAG TPA: trehalase family glycosidase [Candidatus Saccharibacteria bacterium]|nr:trehalase family glycosidase [Candidatus Saccharibacteria bacterium]
MPSKNSPRQIVDAVSKNLSLPSMPSLGPWPRKRRRITAQDVEAARAYIAEYWKKLERFHPNDDESLLGLPHPYLVPSYDETASFDYNELYYWDSFFMAQGLLDTERQELIVGIIEDLLSLFGRFSAIPNASRTYLTGRSQPPFLTTLIYDAYNAFDLDKQWLKRAIAVAKREYAVVWMGTRKPNERLVWMGLSRYYDINHLHDLAEAESGWDMTPRFGRKALEYLPVDLNALLYKYETDFARTARLFGNIDEADEWEKAAETRKKTVDKLMWDRLRGLYYDYNFAKQKRGNISSLAAYFPMWAGMASEKQAESLVKNLRKFENRGGLATTDALPLGQYVPGSMPVQWAYPNGWAPLHFIVVEGLLKYGYREDAERIAHKWLHTNLDWFNQHGVFLEKYNVVNPEKPPQKGVYPSQTGFGWTNAVFERFCRDFID